MPTVAFYECWLLRGSTLVTSLPSRCYFNGCISFMSYLFRILCMGKKDKWISKEQSEKIREHHIFLCSSIEINMKAKKLLLQGVCDSGESDRALKYNNLCTFSLSFCHFSSHLCCIPLMYMSCRLQFFLCLCVICQRTLYFFV